MLKTNRYIIKICTGILTINFLCLTSISYAKETPRAAPLHIKISGAKHKKSKANFNIHTGKIPTKETPVETKPEIAEITTAPPPPKVIETLPCFETTGNNSNRYKNLADSLSLYIKSKNRNPAIIKDIYDAANTTKTDFELLIIKAMIESDLGRATISSKSSARGIFQYIDSTWLSLMKLHGARIGYASYAAVISNDTKNGLPKINIDSQLLKSNILALRENTKTASMIKAYQLKDEANAIKQLKNKSGRVNATDHYIVHMLGLTNAKEFYQLLNESAENKTDSIRANLKEAMNNNRTFFFNEKGQQLTPTLSYQKFSDKISQQYKKLRSIHAEFSNSIMASNRCHLPKVQTVSSAN